MPTKWLQVRVWDRVRRAWRGNGAQLAVDHSSRGLRFIEKKKLWQDPGEVGDVVA
jgi:hypothetical protein